MSRIVDAIVRWIVTVQEVGATHVIIIGGYVTMASPLVVNLESQHWRANGRETFESEGGTHQPESGNESVSSA